MSYTSNFNLNWRVSYLESVISSLIPFLPLNLANVLLAGNNAGASDINLNNNDLLNVSNVSGANNAIIVLEGTGANGEVILKTNGTAKMTLNNSGDIQLTPTAGVSVTAPISMDGVLFANRAIDLNSGELYGAVNLVGQPNQTLTVKTNDAVSSLILNTNSVARLTISNTGFQTFQGGMTYNNVTDTLTLTNVSASINITDTPTNANYYPVFVSGDGSQLLRCNLPPVSMTYNPATDTLVVTNITGTISNATNAVNATNIAVTDDNTANTYYLTFIDSAGTGKTLRADITTSPLSYQPSTGTLTANTFSGTATNANNILVTSDNTAGTYYIPFVKTSGTGNKPLFLDDTTGPFTFNPSTQTLSLGANAVGGGGQYFVRGPAGDIALRIVADGGAISRELLVYPKSLAGSNNPSVALDDTLIVGTSGAGSGTNVLRLTTNSSTNASVRISGTAVLMGAGGAGATATTSINTDGTAGNIVMNTNSTTRLTINQTGELVYNYWDCGNPFIFDDFTSIDTTGPYAWNLTTGGVGASGSVYTGVLDTTANGGLPLTTRIGLYTINVSTTLNSDAYLLSTNAFVRPVQVTSVVWGFIDCGTGNLSSLATPSGLVCVKTIGLSQTNAPNNNDTANGIFWRCNGALANSTWDFVINNVVVQTGPNNQNGRYYRASIEFQLSGGNYQTRGILVDLGNNSSTTSAWTNVPSDLTTGITTYFPYAHLYNGGGASVGTRTLGLDYCMIQNASRPLNRGTNGTTTR